MLECVLLPVGTVPDRLRKKGKKKQVDKGKKGKNLHRKKKRKRQGTYSAREKEKSPRTLRSVSRTSTQRRGKGGKGVRQDRKENKQGLPRKDPSSEKRKGKLLPSFRNAYESHFIEGRGGVGKKKRNIITMGRRQMYLQ